MEHPAERTHWQLRDSMHDFEQLHKQIEGPILLEEDTRLQIEHTAEYLAHLFTQDALAARMTGSVHWVREHLPYAFYEEYADEPFLRQMSEALLSAGDKLLNYPLSRLSTTAEYVCAYMILREMGAADPDILEKHFNARRSKNFAHKVRYEADALMEELTADFPVQLFYSDDLDEFNDVEGSLIAHKIATEHWHPSEWFECIEQDEYS